MTESTNHNTSFHKVAGILEISISAYWSFHNAKTFYDYRTHPEVLRAFIIPDWILIFNFFIGLLGIWCGIKIWRSNWTIVKGYLIFFGLWVIGEIFFFLTNVF